MKTVLGLSVTSAGVGWVLVDGAAPESVTLDDDAFGVDTVDDLHTRGLAAVRGAQAIATASGHEVESIGVTWTDEVAAQAAQLISTLKDSGNGDVRSIRMRATAPTTEDSAVHTAAARAVTLTEADLTVLLDVDVEPDADGPDADDPDADDSITVAVPTTCFTPAHDAARAVATNTVPAASDAGAIHRLKGWVKDASPARLVTMAGAAAVTAVVGLLAVGSQFGGPDVPAPLTTADQPVSPAAGTSQIVGSIPAPAPAAPAQELAVPQQQPDAALPPVYSEPILPVEAGQPAEFPVIPVENQQIPVAAPEPLPAAVPAPAVTPPVPLPVEQGPGPLPGPPPEQQAPVPAAESVPAPAPVDPIQAAINSLFPPAAPAPVAPAVPAPTP
ncbi:hypothetical protein ACXPWS_13775 [Mycobacterium sp. BMJ-28]